MGCCGSRSQVLVDEPKKNEENKGPGQAGGHEGSLIFRDDKMLKRVGDHELEFYTSLFSEDTKDEDLLELRKFVPQYYGVEKIDGKNYLILENLLFNYTHPSLLDCKMGKVTWTPHHNERKTLDQKQKAEKTTTGSLGFRISGFMTKDENGKVLESIAKEAGFYSITPENIHEKFSLVVNNDPKRVKKFIKQTKTLLKWFEKQRSKKFFTASVFYISGKNDCQTRFIDFAHVFDAEGEADNSNF